MDTRVVFLEPEIADFVEGTGFYSIALPQIEEA